MSDNDKRLIEDYLPIKDISAEGSREKSLRKGHISTLHLWWARRPMVASRAAVYGTLVPISRFRPASGPAEKRDSLTRANAAKFMKTLCSYGAPETTIDEARRHIVEAHAVRLSIEKGESVTADDIIANRAPRPIVLDMFAGGGTIPLEAARLGCDAYALDLNPVAHIVELCTLVFPQKFGRPDSAAKGCRRDGSWGGLDEEVRHWGSSVLNKTRASLADLYPPIPDPTKKGKRQEVNAAFWNEGAVDEIPPGFLVPIAYLWTRTVSCKNPTCRSIVPLVKQTWLCKKEGRSVAVRAVAPRNAKQVRFEIAEAISPKALGFDPDVGSKGGNATCPFCSTVADIDYVKAEGQAGKMGNQLIAVVAGSRGSRGWVYLSPDQAGSSVPNNDLIRERTAQLLREANMTIPDESIAALPENCFDNSLGIRVRPYGMLKFADLFTPRQLLFHLQTVAAVRSLPEVLRERGYDPERQLAIVTMLGCVVDRATDFGCRLCVWNAYKDSGTTHAFGRQVITMVWDFSEVNPFNTGNASWSLGLDRVVSALGDANFSNPATVIRGSATAIPLPDGFVDSVVCDPPYYDNVPYSDISDFFYVWLKRSIGQQYSGHFAASNAPKKLEAIADSGRNGGDKAKANAAYESMMAKAFTESHRVLKPGGHLVIVYAHKTTLGWATLVEALRTAGFTVVEAWPLDTEKPGRLRAQESAALASSIFLVARKRDGKATGSYDQVRPDLEEIIRERVSTLWDLGVSGADLVIACVGAGLRAFTRYVRVEYSNGEEVPAERFLTEVETVVLESILARLSKDVGGNGGRYGLSGVDPSTRFYTLWRYTYKMAELDAGEAIIFANGTHVELDGLHGLSSRSRQLVEKKKTKYRLLDYSERGDDAKLGGLSEDGQSAPLIDSLHRLLWLMERHPSGISEFLRETRPNTEQMRLVAQALAGPALKGGELGEVATGTELAALTKLTANWRSVVEDSGVGPLFHAVDRAAR